MSPAEANLEVSRRFVYRADSKRRPWNVLNTRGSKPIYGDCEDYSLTVLWLICDKNLFKFSLQLLNGKARFLEVILPNGELHNLLEYRDPDGRRYVDNIYQKWFTREDMIVKYKYKVKKYFTGFWVLARLLRNRLF